MEEFLHTSLLICPLTQNQEQTGCLASRRAGADDVWALGIKADAWFIYADWLQRKIWLPNFPELAACTRKAKQSLKHRVGNNYYCPCEGALSHSFLGHGSQNLLLCQAAKHYRQRNATRVSILVIPYISFQRSGLIFWVEACHTKIKKHIHLLSEELTALFPGQLIVEWPRSLILIGLIWRRRRRTQIRALQKAQPLTLFPLCKHNQNIPALQHPGNPTHQRLVATSKSTVD